MTAEREELLSSLLGGATPPLANCEFALYSDEGIAPALQPGEGAALSPSAVPKRRMDFALGRRAAHAALAGAGCLRAWEPILQGPSGEPCWPLGWTGAISHSGGVAVAAVGDTEHWAGIGIDLESRQRLPSMAIQRRICAGEESRWIEASPHPPQRLLELFSAKEAIYKAMFVATGESLGFADAELTHDPARRGFDARITRRIDPRIGADHRCFVGCRVTDEFVFTHVFVES